MEDQFSDLLGARRGHRESSLVRVPDHETLIASVIAGAECLPGFLSNPGTGNVRVYGDSVSAKDAAANMQVLLADTGFGHELRIISASETADETGRYMFVLARADDGEVAVEMPGLPLALVRFERGAASPWDFPRLYVDGSSWLWPYALNRLRDFANHEE